MQLLGPVMKPIDDIFVSSVGAMLSQNFYDHGETLPRAPAVDIDMPDRDAGDLLILILTSGGVVQADSKGNWNLTLSGPQDISGASNFHFVFERTATGDVNDEFGWPQSNGNEFDANRVRSAQMIAIKSRSGTPTFLEHIGTEISGDTFLFEMTDRDLPISETRSILTLAIYQGNAEALGSVLSTDAPYGVPAAPATTKLIGESGEGWLQPNPLYSLMGWGHKYMDVVSTTPKEGLVHHPDDIGSFQDRNRYKAESNWYAFHSVP